MNDKIEIETEESEAVAPTEPMSTEDKFLGIKHVVGEEIPKAKEASKAEEESSDLEFEGGGDEEPAKKYHELPDDEKADYSKSVKKRIGDLTRKFHDAERLTTTAEQVRDEAVNFARQQIHQNQQQAALINKGEEYLVQQIKERAGFHIELARNQLSKAHDDEDTEAIVKAQSNLIQAESELNNADNYGAEFAARQPPAQPVQQQPVQQYPVQQRPQQAPASEVSRQWAEENEWFHSKEHPDMTALAYGIHEKLVKQGVRPDTEEYFTAINSDMRERFPKYFDETKETSTDEVRTDRTSPPNVVAPQRRNNGAKPRKVKLTPTQVTLIKKLGLTNEQYANTVFSGTEQGKYRYVK